MGLIRPGRSAGFQTCCVADFQVGAALKIQTRSERRGVCRDFQHLAVSMCRGLHIPARYVTGYLGDIGVSSPYPMDFSAWFEVYLAGRWWAFDARNNTPRIGRVLMAVGRDAADVAITTTFGLSSLAKFTVVTDEVVNEAALVAAPPRMELVSAA